MLSVRSSAAKRFLYSQICCENICIQLCVILYMVRGGGGGGANYSRSLIPPLLLAMRKVSSRGILIRPDMTWNEVQVPIGYDKEDDTMEDVDDGLIALLGKGYEVYWTGVPLPFDIYMEDQRPSERRKNHPRIAAFAQKVLDKLGCDCWNSTTEWIGDVIVLGKGVASSDLPDGDFKRIDGMCRSVKAEFDRGDYVKDPDDVSDAEPSSDMKARKKKKKKEDEEVSASVDPSSEDPKSMISKQDDDEDGMEKEDSYSY